MGAHAHPEKAKVTFDCSLTERTYIKMLATKSHMTLGEFILSYLRKDFPEERKYNKDTMESIKDSREGKGTYCEDIDDFWSKMGMNPNA